MRLNYVALKPALMKAFTSCSTFCTKRGAKAPRGNQQLKIKQAVKNRLGIRQLPSLPASAWAKFLIEKWCGEVVTPSGITPDC